MKTFLVEKLEKISAYEIYKIKRVVVAKNKKEATLRLKESYKDSHCYKLTKMKEL